MTKAPKEWNSLASPSPIPAEAPVIQMVLPLNEMGLKRFQAILSKKSEARTIRIHKIIIITRYLMKGYQDAYNSSIFYK
jgi:hypothetical protein